ncbi:MAG: OmpA family protein [Prolixibacteraceae bacterium]|nr:OmpA family protein [Burkholderiales bacterium]
MIQSTQVQLHRNFYLILICAMLGACATTQRSSTGSGDQAAAPISDAGQAQDAGISPGSNGASSTSNPAKTSGGAGTSSGNTGAKQGSVEGTAAGSDNDDEAQLRRQRAEQDAQVNRLRNDQQVAAEAEAARARDEQAAAEVEETARQSAAASEARPIAQDDEVAVFPANANAVNPGSADTGASAVTRTAERSVYFDYNEAKVPDEYDAMLMANAAYLNAHPALVTEVQGNCDERGSREYNLALGARRAESVKRALELAGADGSRINAISFGSEKPIASGKDEESYTQNRRADIVY